jgi:hypothetical protein
MTVNQAKDVLSNAGYYTGNLWHIADVIRHCSMSEDDAYCILDDALSNEWIIETINNSIFELIQEKKRYETA